MATYEGLQGSDLVARQGCEFFWTHFHPERVVNWRAPREDSVKSDILSPSEALQIRQSWVCTGGDAVLLARSDLRYT